MSTAKFEKLIDLIINEEQEQARALFHEIVVEQSRKIYENMMKDDKEDEADVSSGNDAEDFMSDINSEVDVDEEGDLDDIDASEDEVEDEEYEDEEDADIDDEEDESEESAESPEEDDDEVKERVAELESAIDELKAEFDKLMDAERNEEENYPGIHDKPNEDEEDYKDYDEDEFEKDSDDEKTEKPVREYVERVKSPITSEPSGAQTASPVAKRNNMGGSSKNAVKVSSETGAPTPKSEKIRSSDFANTVGKSDARLKKV